MKSLPTNKAFRQRGRVSASQLNSIQSFVQNQRKGLDIASSTADISAEVSREGQTLTVEAYPRLWLTTAAPSDNTVKAKRVVGSTAAVTGAEKTFNVPIDPP